MTRLITGSTGALGQAITAQIQARGAAEAFVLGARDPSKLSVDGLESRRVDYDDESSMREAFKGVSTLLLISSNAANEVRPRQHSAAIGVARDVEVERIVYTSFVGADRPSDNPLLQVHHATERELQRAGLPWVALRNGLYLDSTVDFLGPFRQTHVVAHPAGDAPAAWISRDDIAAFTVDVLLDEDTRNVALDLVPPETHSLAAIVRTAAQITGVPIDYAQPSNDDYLAMLAQAGVDADLAGILLQVCQAMREGAFDVSSDEFERRMGRQPESVTAYLERHLHETKGA